ncbi:MAG: cytochrome c oxidase subunit 4 [Bacteroidales bacterium]
MDNELTERNTRDYPPYPSDPAIVPDSTYWPLSLAFGITLFFWGFLTTIFLSFTGLVFMIISIAGWITELNHEK